MTTPENAHPAYRADIDGLRAIAVLSVVVYHAFPIWGGGGFIGVDIFFVISGYLISTIIYKGVAEGSFSYVDFYDRRIRRIFPALILVLAVTLLFAVTMTFPVDTRSIGKQVVGGAGFVANLVFWNEAGYFDGASELKPLLHLWSLSVEEQYYIVWPWVVALLFTRKRAFIAVALLLFGASFALNIATVSEHRDAAFYSPLSRTWELLVGALLAYRSHLGPTGSARLAACGLSGAATRPGFGAADVASALGAALIVAGLVLTTPLSAFPGWWALLPTVGAVLLIGAGSHAGFNRLVLSNRILVFFGKISYPLYLWHWPLLAFPKIYGDPATRNVRIAAVVTAIALAWLTYRFVEKPIRFGTRRVRVPWLLTGAVASLAGVGAALMLSEGWLSRLPPDLRDISRAESVFDYHSYRNKTCFLGETQTPAEFAAECAPPPSPGSRSVWLWGDSHVAALYPGMQRLMADDPRLAVTQYTAAACPPVLGMEVMHRPHCRATNDEVMKRLTAAPPDTVLMGANWTFYNGQYGWETLDEKALAETARRVRQAGVRHVVILGPLPRWQMSQPVILLREWRDDHHVPVRSFRSFNKASFGADAVTAQAARDAGVDFISPLQALCDATGCLQTLTVDGIRYPVAWDEAHLTVAASKQLVETLIGPWLVRTSPAGRP